MKAASFNVVTFSHRDLLVMWHYQDAEFRHSCQCRPITLVWVIATELQVHEAIVWSAICDLLRQRPLLMRREKSLSERAWNNLQAKAKCIFNKVKHEEEPRKMVFSSDERNIAQGQKANHKLIRYCIKSPKTFRPLCVEILQIHWWFWCVVRIKGDLLASCIFL